MIIFDFDQTLVDTNLLEPLRRKRDWPAVQREMRALEPYSGITDLLNDLNETGHKVAIVTHSPDSVARAFSDRQRWPVACIIGYSSSMRRKPSPDGLLEALKLCGEPAYGSYHVGDRDIDTYAAHAAGVVALGAGWGTLDLGALRSSRPDEIFLSVVELRAFLLER